MACVFEQTKAALWLGHLFGMTPITHHRHSGTEACRVGFELFSPATGVAVFGGLLNLAVFVFGFIGALNHVYLERSGTEIVCVAIIVAALTIDWVVSMISSIVSVPKLQEMIEALNFFDNQFNRESLKQLSESIRLRTWIFIVFYLFLEIVGISMAVYSAMTMEEGRYEMLMVCITQVTVMGIISVRYLQFFIIVRHLENRFRVLRSEIEKSLQDPLLNKLFVDSKLVVKFDEKFRVAYIRLLDLLPLVDKLFPERIVYLATALLQMACYTYKILSLVFFHDDFEISFCAVLMLLNLSAVLRIYATGDAGSRITEAALATVQHVQRTSNLTHEMELFLLVANGRQNPCITATGFFSLSRGILCSVINVVITYVIVLLQFQSGDKGGPTEDSVLKTVATPVLNSNI